MPERTIGNYVVGPLLGRGGMSEVYAAEHRFLGDRVAIKLLRSHLAGDADATRAFVAEANRTRAIDHPNVVRVLDFGSDGDDCYLVMERLEGDTLAARLEASRLGEAEVRRLGAAIADGVAAAHQRGIVHRDLKPGNIVLVGDTPKIVDFGIARMFSGGATVTRTRIGSLAYMAPEQITEGMIAPSIDIWSLGVILFEALAGRLPFQDFANGRTPQLFDPPPRLALLASVSPALEALIAACLERDPARRPPSMRELAAQLRASSDPRVTEDLAPLGRGTDPCLGSDAGEAPRVEVEPRAAASADERAIATEDTARSRRRGRAIVVAALVAAVAITAGWSIATSETAVLAPIARTTVAPADVAPPPPPRAPTPAAAVPATPPAAATPSATTPAAGFTVEVRSAPPGASVSVGGKRVGVTPAKIALDLPASLVVTRAGYQPSRVRAERAGPINVRLVPARRAPTRAAGETLD